MTRDSSVQWALPGGMSLLAISSGLIRSRVLHVVAELGIADLLKSGPLNCGQLAVETGTNEEALYRLLRAAAAMGVLVEIEDRSFELNDSSRMLRRDVPGSLRDLVLHFGADWQMRASAQLMHSVQTGAPAFDHVFGCSLFDYMDRHETDARLFDVAMARITESACGAVIDSYDFSNVSSVMDVGGGNGELLSAVLARHPALSGWLLDRPHVIEAARRKFAAAGLADRVRLLPGDFLAEVPAGAEILVLKNVIHDWDTERAVRILQNCRRTLRQGGRVLLIEAIVAERNEGAFGKLSDIGMLLSTGGRERSEGEYRELLSTADLRLRQVIPTRSAFCVLEAVGE